MTTTNSRRAFFTRQLAAAGLIACLAAVSAAQTAYPPSPKGDVTDTIHGQVVPDPYRWLETYSPETKAWIDAQSEMTFQYLATIPEREAIKNRITRLFNFERFTTPVKEGGRYFYSRNDGLQRQNVLLVADKLDAPPRVLIDPNAMNAAGTSALGPWSVSDDGKLIAYSVQEAGSDWQYFMVRDVETGKDLPDRVNWVKFSGASWTKDGKGFFYSRFDKPEEGSDKLLAVNEFPKVYYHALGTSQDADVLIYERPDQPDWGLNAGVTDDGRYLVLNVSQGTDRKNRFYYRDLSANPLDRATTKQDNVVRQREKAIGAFKKQLAAAKKAGDNEAAKKIEAEIKLNETGRNVLTGLNGGSHGFIELLNDFDASYDFIDNIGTVFYFSTDLSAPRGRVIAIDTTSPERKNWKEVIPQSDATLSGASIVGDHIVAQYLENAASKVRVFTTAGAPVREVALPGIGSAGGFGGKRSDSETFYVFTGYTQPATIYTYDVKTGNSTVFKSAKVDFDPAAYETKQVFVTSKDGTTKVPMFIVAKKGIKLDGSNPTLLYGYGGFGIPMTPGFSVGNLVWCEMGGVYAVACLRGGGEYGEQWHMAGTKLTKQNVFDDFIACAQWLHDNKYTSPAKLAIQGGSNGGLLVGACMTQRPELFGAALPAVGVMDMLRFHLFTIGKAWRSDYGSADDSAEQFEVLYRYSPYHQLLRDKPGTKYPATLVTTADHDDRVVPAHSFKFAAALQAAGAPDGKFNPQNPLLIRIEKQAGHGGGMPTDKRIALAADQWAFLVRHLGFKPTLPPSN
jgi:prolyl oligopeptidase